MKFAITSVEFSFNNIMYRQVDGISMGSVLVLTMAGIFVGFHEVDFAQSAGAVEYTDCTSARGVRPPQRVSWI